MLRAQTQTLPWRAALRQGHHTLCRDCRRQFLSSCRSSSATPLPSTYTRAGAFKARLQIRDFSSHSARRKEKSPDDISKKSTIENGPKKVESESEEVPSPEDTVESKKAPPEPQPIPQSSGADGKATSAGGAGGAGAVGGAGGGESGSSSSSGSGGSDGGRRARRAPTERGIAKPTVPDVYPQVMAIPIAKRPLFPGFYKAVTIRDPNVSAAITEMIKRGQPYVGAFLFKDDTATDK